MLLFHSNYDTDLNDLSEYVSVILACLAEQFACDGFCLSMSKICNGVKDCVDGQDEGDGCGRA